MPYGDSKCALNLIESNKRVAARFVQNFDGIVTESKKRRSEKFSRKRAKGI
jgi:hypothetical protein